MENRKVFMPNQELTGNWDDFSHLPAGAYNTTAIDIAALRRFINESCADQSYTSPEVAQELNPPPQPVQRPACGVCEPERQPDYPAGPSEWIPDPRREPVPQPTNPIDWVEEPIQSAGAPRQVPRPIFTSTEGPLGRVLRSSDVVEIPDSDPRVFISCVELDKTQMRRIFKWHKEVKLIRFKPNGMEVSRNDVMKKTKKHEETPF